jgi:hypothetical protein
MPGLFPDAGCRMPASLYNKCAIQLQPNALYHLNPAYAVLSLPCRCIISTKGRVHV